MSSRKSRAQFLAGQRRDLPTTIRVRVFCGGLGHHQRPPLPGGSTGPEQSGDPGQNLPGGRGGLRRRNRRAVVFQPGGPAGRGRPVGPYCTASALNLGIHPTSADRNIMGLRAWFCQRPSQPRAHLIGAAGAPTVTTNVANNPTPVASVRGMKTRPRKSKRRPDPWRRNLRTRRQEICPSANGIDRRC